MAGSGLTVDIGGPVHYVDYGGPGDAVPVVLVHGLGGSHLNWDLFAPALLTRARVLALDLPGFGLSEPGDRVTTVPVNVGVLERFVREVAGGPAVLVGNSMGGMISILLAERAPELVRGLVLVDPALPPPPSLRHAAVTGVFLLYSLPVVGERVAAIRRRRQGARQMVRTTLQLCGVDPDALPPELLGRSVALVENRRDVAGMDRAFVSAARSLVWVLARGPRYRRAMARVTVPVLLVHGELDRLVSVEAAREAARHRPDWRYLELAGVGHIPQLQVPDQLADEVLGWLADLDAVGAP